MKIKIFCRCSLFPSWSGEGLISTHVLKFITKKQIGRVWNKLNWLRTDWKWRAFESTVMSHRVPQNAWNLLCSRGTNVLWNLLALLRMKPDSHLPGVEHRNKPQPTFCVTVKFWLHSDRHIWIFWTQRILRI